MNPTVKAARIERHERMKAELEAAKGKPKGGVRRGGGRSSGQKSILVGKSALKSAVLLAVTAMMTTVAYATPCIPNTVVDSQPVPQSCYGGTLTAIPGSTASIFSNDNLFSAPSNDLDANDLFGTAAFSEDGTQATFTLLGGLSAHLSYWQVGDVVLFTNRQAVGTQSSVAVTPWALVPLFGVDTVTGNVYAAVVGNQNFIIDQEMPESVVPEPGTFALLAFGAAVLALWLLWKASKVDCSGTSRDRNAPRMK